MTRKYFIVPFANAGDVTSVPDATQSDGSVSYQSGYPAQYSLNPDTDANAKRIGRSNFNGILKDITQAIKQLQEDGVPEFISATDNGGSAFSYSKGAIVGLDGVLYQSLSDANTTTPPSSSWVELPSSQFGYMGTASGTNTIVVNYTPAVTVLVGGAKYKFTAAGANTGAATININGIGAKSVYGLANLALQGGEISGLTEVEYDAANDRFILLSSAGGSLQIKSGSQSQHAAALNQVVSVIGSARNLKCSVTSISATATFTADELILETALGGLKYQLSSFSKSINLATTGAGGMDTGAAPASGDVAIYAIYNPSSATSALLAATTTSATPTEVYSGANMPSGYTASCLLTVLKTNSSGQILPCLVMGRDVYTSARLALSTSTYNSSWQSLAVSGAIPYATKKVGGYAYCNGATAAATNYIGIAGSNDTGIAAIGAAVINASNSGVEGGFNDIPIITAATIYYYVTSTSTPLTAAIYISKYSI